MDEEAPASGNPTENSADKDSAAQAKEKEPGDAEKMSAAAKVSAEESTESEKEPADKVSEAKAESSGAKDEKSNSAAEENELEAALSAEKGADKSNVATSSSDRLQQAHVSKILDEVLEEPVEPATGHHGFKHPMILDIFLGVALLIAMSGFSIGMFKIYVTHSAKQSINQHNYKAAIVLLKGTPFPGFFTMSGSEDTLELLNRALYLDAIEKLEVNNEDESALKELEQIQPGSGYFELAQDILRDHAKPSRVQLEGGASHEASPSDPEIEEKKPLLPEDEPKDASP
ncbi:MAG TPA: hypothetical protein V6D17_09545 [Candidatus Obscuribacterales bacterium]